MSSQIPNINLFDGQNHLYGTNGDGLTPGHSLHITGNNTVVAISAHNPDGASLQVEIARIGTNIWVPIGEVIADSRVYYSVWVNNYLYRVRQLTASATGVSLFVENNIDHPIGTSNGGFKTSVAGVASGGVTLPQVNTAIAAALLTVQPTVDIQNSAQINVGSTPTAANGITDVVVNFPDGTVEYWSRPNDATAFTLDGTTNPNDNNPDYFPPITRTNSTLNVVPTALEAPDPNLNDVAPVFLLDGTVQYFRYNGTAWVTPAERTVLPTVAGQSTPWVDVSTDTVILASEFTNVTDLFYDVDLSAGNVVMVIEPGVLARAVQASEITFSTKGSTTNILSVYVRPDILPATIAAAPTEIVYPRLVADVTADGGVHYQGSGSFIIERTLEAGVDAWQTREIN